MGRKGFPETQIDNVQPEQVQEIVSSLRQLHDRGKPESDEEVRQRIDDYFAFCEESSIRPGIESLSLSLHISRQSLYRWSNGEDCSAERAEMIQSAKAFISAYIEQAMLSGKISPPSGIFLMKNWLGYKDTISLDESVPHERMNQALSAAELPKLKLPAGQQELGKEDDFNDIR